MENFLCHAMKIRIWQINGTISEFKEKNSWNKYKPHELTKGEF